MEIKITISYQDEKILEREFSNMLLFHIDYLKDQIEEMMTKTQFKIDGVDKPIISEREMRDYNNNKDYDIGL